MKRHLRSFLGLWRWACKWYFFVHIEFEVGPVTYFWVVTEGRVICEWGMDHSVSVKGQLPHFWYTSLHLFAAPDLKSRLLIRKAHLRIFEECLSEAREGRIKNEIELLKKFFISIGKTRDRINIWIWACDFLTTKFCINFCIDFLVSFLIWPLSFHCLEALFYLDRDFR